MSSNLNQGANRAVRDSECKQGKCARPTVGCWGKCGLHEQISPVVVNQGASIEAELLRCPFCGTQATLLRDRISCDSCLADMGKLSTESTAQLIAAWNRRTPAATTGDGELPPLPKCKMLSGSDLNSLHVLYTAGQMRDYARAVIEADRAQRQQANACQLTDEELAEPEYVRGYIESQNESFAEAMAHIADLRAQLATKGQGEQKVECFALSLAAVDEYDPQSFINGAKWQAAKMAAPASAQPADPLAAVRALAEKWNQDAIKDGFAGSEPAFELLEVLEAGAAVPDGWRENVASQCRATATSDIAANVLVDGGSGTLRELLVDAANAILAASPAAQPAKDEQMEREAIERRAKEIYATFAFADRYPWVEGGNSIRQDEARDAARKELKQYSANNSADEQKGDANG